MCKVSVHVKYFGRLCRHKLFVLFQEKIYTAYLGAYLNLHTNMDGS